MPWKLIMGHSPPKFSPSCRASAYLRPGISSQKDLKRYFFGILPFIFFWILMMRAEDKPEGQWPSSAVYITPYEKKSCWWIYFRLLLLLLFSTWVFGTKSRNHNEHGNYCCGKSINQCKSICFECSVFFWCQYVVTLCNLSKLCQTKYWHFKSCLSIKYRKPIYCHSGILGDLDSL